MPAGRPTKFSEEVRKIILESIATGSPREHAAKRARIHPDTLRQWLKKAVKATRGEYFEFLGEIKRLEAERLNASVGRIEAAAIGGIITQETVTTTTKTDGTVITKTVKKMTMPQWQADAWFLERRYPEDFAANTMETKELRKAVVELAKKRTKRNAAAQESSGT